MNDSNDKRLATSSATAVDLDYPSTLPGFRPRQPTLIGVAPAAPIVSGRTVSVHGEQASGDEALLDVDPDVPASRVRARSVPAPAASAPLPPRVPKHSLDAIAIGEEALPAVHRGPQRKWIALMTVVAMLAAALAATVCVRRLASGGAAPPAVATSVAVPPSAPPRPDDAPVIAVAPSATTAPAVNLAPSPGRHEKAKAKPPRKSPVRRKHPPKPARP